jgi:hypothetical protein
MREIQSQVVKAKIVCNIELEVLLEFTSTGYSEWVPKHYIRDTKGKPLSEEVYKQGTQEEFLIDDWFCKEKGIECIT